MSIRKPSRIRQSGKDGRAVDGRISNIQSGRMRMQGEPEILKRVSGRLSQRQIRIRYHAYPWCTNSKITSLKEEISKV